MAILCTYAGNFVGGDSLPRKPSLEYLLCRIEVEEWSFNYIHNLLGANPICRRKSRQYEGRKSARIVYIGHVCPMSVLKISESVDRGAESNALYSAG